MLIALSSTLHLKMRHTYKVGDTFYLQLRVPKDLLDRFPRALIRESLGTKDPVKAAREVDHRVKHYTALFASMRGNQELKPAELTSAAVALAKEYGNVDVFAELLADPKFQAHARAKGIDDDPYMLELVKFTDYLNPVECEALKILQTGKLQAKRLSDAFKTYQETHEKKAGDADFMANVKRDWDGLIDLVGDIPVEDLQKEHGRRYITHRLKTVKTTTVKRNLAHIHAVINAAWAEWDLARKNPFDRLKIPSLGADSKKRAIPAKDQVREMFERFRQETRSTSLLVLLHIGTGARVGELSLLAKSDLDLDFEVPYLHIRPNAWRDVKTASSTRQVPLTAQALRVINIALEQSGDNPALFPEYARPKGNTAASAAVNKRLRDWGITTHSFRHWLKDALREIGCPQDIRDAIQGHASGNVADLYGFGHSLATKRDWLAKVEERFLSTKPSA